ncbi:PTS mannitol transporter subunit IICB, partial [Schumannella luteola]
MTTTSPTTAAPRGGGARVAVQRFGTFLSGMIMPNIAAFIAWGLVTAMFIDNGWVGNNSPVEAWRWADSAMLGGGTTPDGTEWVGLVGPMITYLLPLLIGYTGGRMVYGVRGAVIGTVVTMGVVIGAAGTVMFLGAMICGPLSAWLLKQVDKIWAGKIKPGFEMLVDNFSSGILGFLLALAAFFGLAPLIKIFSDALGAAVNWLIATHLIPLASIIVEPAK